MTTADALKSSVGAQGTGIDLTDLERCIEAASQIIEQETGRLFLTASVTEYHDGSAARGRSRSLLYTRHFPIVWPGSPAMTVSENGIALTPLIGYQASADVLVSPDKGLLIRGGRSIDVLLDDYDGLPNVGRWTPGYQNVAVTYQTGAALGSIPADIVQACIELTWFLNREPMRTGVQSVGMAGASTSYVKDLSPVAQRTIQHYRRDARPVTASVVIVS